jgi:hypothetical protein
MLLAVIIFLASAVVSLLLNLLFARQRWWKDRTANGLPMMANRAVATQTRVVCPQKKLAA